jgi:hypothetical protein
MHTVWGGIQVEYPHIIFSAIVPIGLGIGFYVGYHPVYVWPSHNIAASFGGFMLQIINHRIGLSCARSDRGALWPCSAASFTSLIDAWPVQLFFINIFVLHCVHHHTTLLSLSIPDRVMIIKGCAYHCP